MINVQIFRRQMSGSQFIDLNNMDSFGVVSEDGKTIYTWGVFNQLEIIKWLSEEDFRLLMIANLPMCLYVLIKYNLKTKDHSCGFLDHQEQVSHSYLDSESDHD